VSRFSRTNASTSPTARPSTAPISIVFAVSPPIGASGSVAGRTIETSWICSASLMSAS